MTAKIQHFGFAISPVWRPALLPLGVTANRAYMEVGAEDLHVRFGFFDYHFALDEIEDAVVSRWPVWAGVGARTNFRGVVGLLGSYVNVVEIRFKEPQQVRLLARVPCRRLFISVEEPHAFIAALKRRATGEAKAA